MKKGYFYKHPNAPSICMEVLKVFEIPNHTDVRIKVRWWRLKFGKVDYCMNFVENFRKPATYLKEWKRISAQEATDVYLRS